MTRARTLPALAMLTLLVAFVAPPTGRAATGATSQTLQVFAAASLADAFNDLGRMLEQQHPGLVVRFNYTGSQQLAAQLEQGAVADLYASADDRWMSYAQDRGLVVGDPWLFARNRLVVIVPKTNPARIQKVQDIAKGGIKIVLGADAVPVGRYSRMVIRNLSRSEGFPSDFATRTLANVVSEEENVKSVVSKVQLGEADAGIVYHSDVTPAVARYVRVFEVPDSANVIASYPMALVRGGTAPEAAKAFMELVLSAEGQRVLERHGLMPVAASNP